MTEMERRVADAIARHIDMSGIIPLDAARAAIEAMRDPTPAMIAMAESYTDFILLDAVGPNTVERRREEMRMAWQKAIDTALSEGLPTSDKQDHISRP